MKIIWSKIESWGWPFPGLNCYSDRSLSACPRFPGLCVDLLLALGLLNSFLSASGFYSLKVVLPKIENKRLIFTVLYQRQIILLVTVWKTPRKTPSWLGLWCSGESQNTEMTKQGSYFFGCVIPGKRDFNCAIIIFAVFYAGNNNSLLTGSLINTYSLTDTY